MATEQQRIETQILSLAETLLPAPDLYLVAVAVRGLSGGTVKVEVLADGDQGITIDQITELARALGHQMEEQDVIPGKYLLDVGSPGVDHPLGSPRAFAKNVGRTLKVDLADGRTLESELLSADQAGIALAPLIPKKKPKPSENLPTPGPIPLSYGEIKKAVVQVRF